MTQSLPEQASAVVIGGGVIGASIAYHLSRAGWNDVVLLERSQFACGTSWHAAGLIGTMRANENHARLCEYSNRLLGEIEEETGQATGYRQVGSLSVAHSEDRFEELKRVAAMNNAFGVTQVDIITPQEAGDLAPILKTDDLIGASWVAADGHASPVDVVSAFIKGARNRGAHCLEGVQVTDIDWWPRVCGVASSANSQALIFRYTRVSTTMRIPRKFRTCLRIHRLFAIMTSVHIFAKTPAVFWWAPSSPKHCQSG